MTFTGKSQKEESSQKLFKTAESFDWQNEDLRRELLKKVELISHDKIQYDKPIAIIYNPASGRKINIKGIISSRLDNEQLPYEFLESTKYFETWEIAQNLDMDKYSAFVAVGGDGTYHEVVNGMLHRSDRRRIPVAFIPNGSGNDTLRSFNIFDVNKALDYIVKSDLIKIDVTKVLIDCESEESVSPEDRISKIRYQVNNTSLSLPARIAAGASRFKSCCCNAY